MYNCVISSKSYIIRLEVLDRNEADAAGRRVDEHTLALLELRKVAEGLLNGHEDDGHRAGVLDMVLFSPGIFQKNVRQYWTSEGKSKNMWKSQENVKADQPYRKKKTTNNKTMVLDLVVNKLSFVYLVSCYI